MSEVYNTIEDMNEDAVRETCHFLLKKKAKIYQIKDVQESWCYKRVFFIKGIRREIIFYLRETDSYYDI